ncbi:MAG TPA: FHA domain-containing protein [Spirochaetota bacterium]|nr:FHA domain-containing protein [Spirochaetota bacterium]HOL57389.1 FHA domain-containing protein [Spirochaetota bacterium]HPP04919.1 FHA domain-containing protein [Spirochaetota bacterium]
MKCYNCGSIIPDDSKSCPECNVIINRLKIEENEIDSGNASLILNNGTSFKLEKNIKEISIGRSDFSTTPTIDIGPYDTGPYISRIHGIFLWEEDSLYYIDKSKNGTFLNNVRLKKDEKVKLKNGDKIKFVDIEAEICIK